MLSAQASRFPPVVAPRPLGELGLIRAAMRAKFRPNLHFFLTGRAFRFHFNRRRTALMTESRSRYQFHTASLAMDQFSVITLIIPIIGLSAVAVMVVIVLVSMPAPAVVVVK